MAGSLDKESEGDFPSSRPLHNFTLPSQLKWGRRKHLRCVKSSSQYSSTTSTTATNPDSSESPTTLRQCKSPISANKNLQDTITSGGVGVGGGGGGGGRGGTTEMEALREKLMSDLKVAVDDDHLVQLKTPKEKEKFRKDDQEEELPWNLRKNRRAINSKAKLNEGAGNMQQSASSGSAEQQQQQRSKFSLTLSREEIETDFLLMTGAKPPRRPKKRSRPIQKQLDGLFPGSWLTEVTPDIYKVSDVHEPKAPAEK